MSQEVGKRENFYRTDIQINDNGVLVKNVLKLIEGSPYYEELYENMSIDKIKDEVIQISGANKLVSTVLAMDKKFLKFDIHSELKNVKCNGLLDKKNAVIEISEIEDEAIRKMIGSDIVKGITKYSVKSDYLDKIYHADKFLNYCYDNEYEEFIKKSLDFIEENNKRGELKKQFRMLKDSKSNYFVRAITSVESYKNYNINFSVFVALISLHKLSKSSKDIYDVRYCSVSESDVRVVFRRNSYKSIGKDLKVGFELELVNDEIKREAVKFNGLFSISYSNDKVISIKPDINAKIINFSHRVGVKKVWLLLSGLSDAIDDFTQEMYKDIELIKKSESPEELKKALYIKVKNAQQKEFRENYKKEVQLILEKENVSTFYELLDLMNKVDLLIDDSDIKAKDYWKYKLYEVLVKGKNEKR
ncbi:hypothetical protein [Tenacibaculum soleae]|uniref:hypothetical protein n=1 Tax=Tenacibaculum soleae TaxID=447689 RepID=UPI0026E15DC0|nr:hypothetical protein [Tenacibaculum soleae]MDO6813231.1 hypothetical protein [Tenacibaculum soleae]